MVHCAVKCSLHLNTGELYGASAEIFTQSEGLELGSLLYVAKVLLNSCGLLEIRNRMENNLEFENYARAMIYRRSQFYIIDICSSNQSSFFFLIINMCI